MIVITLYKIAYMRRCVCFLHVYLSSLFIYLIESPKSSRLFECQWAFLSLDNYIYYAKVAIVTRFNHWLLYIRWDATANIYLLKYIEQVFLFMMGLGLVSNVKWLLIVLGNKIVIPIAYFFHRDTIVKVGTNFNNMLNTNKYQWKMKHKKLNCK